MGRILIIDDCKPFLAALTRVLQRAGYDVQATHSGRLGVECMKERSFDLVLSDIYMPELDGLELLQFARNGERKVPVILMSGFARSVDMLPAAKHLGAAAVLAKPIAVQRLLDAVATSLAGAPDLECRADGN